MSNKTKKQSGFGLVEVIVSISILSMVSLVLVSLSTMVHFNSENSRNRTIANSIMQDTIEEIHNARDSNVLSGKDWAGGIADDSKEISMDNKKFILSKKITDADSSLPSGAPSGSRKKIAITITWSESSGSKEIKAETYITNWRPKY